MKRLPAESEAAAPKEPPKPPSKWTKVPWGLLIVLTVYAAGVYAYIWTNYYDSPEYKAAISYAKALAILGVNDGRRCSEAELNKAFELTMQASQLLPEEKMLVDHLEDLRHRFEERKFKLNKEWVNAVEMMSARTLRIEHERAAYLVVGSRDRGWAPDQLLKGPERVVLWSIPGGVFIILFWAYTQFSTKAKLDREHEEKLKKQEQEVEELGEYRRKLGRDGRPLPNPGEDEPTDTIASPQPVKVKPHNISRVSAPGLRPVTKTRPPVQRKREPGPDDE